MAQETSVDKELTACENIQFTCESYGVPTDDDRNDDLVALADLADVADKSPKTVSGGMKKRLDVTTALVTEQVLLPALQPIISHHLVQTH